MNINRGWIPAKNAYEFYRATTKERDTGSVILIINDVPEDVSGPVDIKAAKDVFEDDAIKLEMILRGDLPGETYDKLFARMALVKNIKIV